MTEITVNCLQTHVPQNTSWLHQCNRFYGSYRFSLYRTRDSTIVHSLSLKISLPICLLKIVLFRLNKSFSYQFQKLEYWIHFEAFSPNLNISAMKFCTCGKCFEIILQNLVNFMVCLLPGNIKLIIRKEESHWHMPMYHVHFVCNVNIKYLFSSVIDQTISSTCLRRQTYQQIQAIFPFCITSDTMSVAEDVIPFIVL